MKLQTFCLDNSSPSVTRPEFVNDPQKSLVILFGSPHFLKVPERMGEQRAMALAKAQVQQSVQQFHKTFAM